VGTEYGTSSDTATHDEYRKVLEKLEHTDFSHINAQGFVNKVNETGEQVQGNPFTNVGKSIEKGAKDFGKKLNDKYPGPSNINNIPREVKKFDESHPSKGPIVAPPTGDSTPNSSPIIGGL